MSRWQTEAVASGTKLGILQPYRPVHPPRATPLEMEAAETGKKIEIKTVINEAAFQHLLNGEVDRHNELVHMELEKLQHEVDVIVLGQISLAQIQFEAKVPVLQVADSGFAHARKLLNSK